MPSLTNDFFETNIKIIKWSGMWVPKKGTSAIIRAGYILFNSFWIGYSVCLFTPSEFMTLGSTAGNLSDLMKNLNMAMTHLLGAIKVITWFANRKEILEIVDTLRINTVAYEAINDYNPDKIVKKDKKLKDWVSVFFLSMAFTVSLSSCINCFLVLIFDSENQFVYQQEGFNNTKAIYNQKLPYFSWIPWDHTKSKFNFACAVLFQFFPVFNYAFIIVGFDTLFVAIISYTSCQLKILQGAFRTVRERCLRNLDLPNVNTLRDSEFVAKELNVELNKSIKSLQVIFNVCEKLESIFTYITFVQLQISLLVFCTCLYLLSSVPVLSEKFLVEFIYMVAIEVELWIYCYFGNEVTLRGDDIPLSLYEGDWFSADKSFKSSMLITMTRMRRPIYLTVGKFTPLTIATFVTIGRGSYSFFAVLKNSN